MIYYDEAKNCQILSAPFLHHMPHSSRLAPTRGNQAAEICYAAALHFCKLLRQCPIHLYDFVVEKKLIEPFRNHTLKDYCILDKFKAILKLLLVQFSIRQV
jgi:hypothetical protein